MSVAKVAVTLDQETLNTLDDLVKKRVFRSRSGAVQTAVAEKLQRLSHSRLARECEKLDPEYERVLAEEGMSAEISEWPDY
jgi:metal-responsive CopG/Arc/MetJ family transcriptional regulator